MKKMQIPDNCQVTIPAGTEVFLDDSAETTQLPGEVTAWLVWEVRYDGDIVEGKYITPDGTLIEVRREESTD